MYTVDVLLYLLSLKTDETEYEAEIVLKCNVTTVSLGLVSCVVCHDMVWIRPGFGCAKTRSTPGGFCGVRVSVLQELK